MRIPKHIQTELDQLIDELRFSEESFDELLADSQEDASDKRQALLTKTDYSVRVEVAIFKRRKYYVVEHNEYSFDGMRAHSERSRYLIEPTSSTTFQTFEL